MHNPSAPWDEYVLKVGMREYWVCVEGEYWVCIEGEEVDVY